MFAVVLRLTIILFRFVTCLLNSTIEWWVIRELINMLAIYYLVFTSKETSESDVNTYILIIFRASSIVFLGCVTSSNVVLSVRVIAKLRLVPIHNPVLNMCSKLNLSSLVIFIVAPKLPYFLICSELPVSLFMIPARLATILSFFVGPIECVRFALVVSSNALAIAFAVDLRLRLLSFGGALIWGVLVTVLYKESNVSMGDNYNNFRYLFNIILPVPRSYSWILKVTIIQESVLLNFYAISFLVVLMSFPFWYVVCITAFNKTKFVNDPEVKRVNMVQPLLYTCIFAYIFIV